MTGALYRYPAVLAKAVTTLDVLSGGRAVLGISAGWNEQESRGLGIPFPPVSDRFEQLEDALNVCLGRRTATRRTGASTCMPSGF